MKNYLEHANITVEDAVKTAELFCRLFDWQIRWQGESLDGGYSVHVGEEDSYLALYSHSKATVQDTNSYQSIGAMNHIGIIVGDLDDVELKVKAEGIDPHHYAEYEPGKRFYFYLPDKIEVEVATN